MKLILLGAPGAGKGTQGIIISDKYSIPIISTGDMLRAAIREGTELGLHAKSLIDKGALVPDTVIMAMLKERLQKNDCSNGFILDGVPRTINQAEALAEITEIDKVLEIHVPDEFIIDRITNRIVCPKCGASYNAVSKRPREEGICDRCGSKLEARADDNKETLLERLSVYHKMTEPLKDFYADQGKLVVIDGTESVDDVTVKVLETLRG
ncbi:MAG: adenylate kinase [Oscillospiraceae bacterium]|nr:adenylate kinase [Oscillospiraceae bacterium]